MDRVEVTRNGETDEFSVVLTRGGDMVRCMVTVAAGRAGAQSHAGPLRRAPQVVQGAMTALLDMAPIIIPNVHGDCNQIELETFLSKPV